MAQFDSLTNYLKGTQGNDIMLTLQKLDAILSPEKLPTEARNRRKWWENTTQTPQGAAWLSAGWEVMNANLIHGEITFSRENTKRFGQLAQVISPVPSPKPRP